MAKGEQPKPPKKPEPTAAEGSAKAAVPAPSSDKPKEKPGKFAGKKFIESPFNAWLQSAGRYTVGKAGSVQAVVVAKGSYKCNDAYPFKFKLNAPPAGVSYPSTISRAVSRGAKRTVVSIPFTPSSAGSKTISGKYYLSVCNESVCKTMRAPLSVSITVHDD